MRHRSRQEWLSYLQSHRSLNSGYSGPRILLPEIQRAQLYDDLKDTWNNIPIAGQPWIVSSWTDLAEKIWADYSRYTSAYKFYETWTERIIAGEVPDNLMDLALIRLFQQYWYFDTAGTTRNKSAHVQKVRDDHRWLFDLINRYESPISLRAELVTRQREREQTATCKCGARLDMPWACICVTTKQDNNQGEKDMFRTQTAILIDGTVGQVVSQSTGQIVWQSVPFEDKILDDAVKVTAEQQAKEAALEAIKSAEMEMFKPATKKSRS